MVDDIIRFFEQLELGGKKLAAYTIAVAFIGGALGHTFSPFIDDPIGSLTPSFLSDKDDEVEELPWRQID